MAGGVVLNTESKRYPGRATFYIYFCVILGGMGGLLLGYDNGVIGGVIAMPSFLEKFFPTTYENETNYDDTNTSPYCKYDDQILQLVVSSLYISAMFAGLIAAPFARLYGRKPVLLVAGVSFVVGAGILGGAVDVAMLVIGRILLGIGVGLASLVMPMYNAEMAPTHMRGGMNILFQLFVTIGILVAGLINYGANHITTGQEWRMPLLLGALPGLIVCFGGIVLPDSPNSLVERGHVDRARAVLVRIRGTDNVDEELTDIIETARQSNLVKNTMLNLWTPKYRPQLVISLLFMLFQQFTGINAVVFYAPVLFSSIGNGATAALLNTVIIGAVNVLSTLVAVFFVDKLGRKFLLIVGGIQCFITQIIVGVTLKYEFAKYGATLPTNVSWGILAVICVFINGFAYSWGPIGWLYPTEIQPLETRSAGASINVASNMLFTFVIGQTFVTMLCTMEWGVYMFFAGMIVIMVLWVILFLPETRGVPLEQVFRLFQKHWFWGRFPAIQTLHTGSDIPQYQPAGKTSFNGKPIPGDLPVGDKPGVTPMTPADEVTKV